ncbi:MAG: aminotransferase class III-fold pyridoxal phosphate-dependent enzyme [Nitrospinaceae bacterium]|jgi:glutamate-1-semialdehyde 2,1-aminomutase|nr:aminotransferase class III-fold pyridoxal phosphate-dependent enzyme [Nitrospinaceae bacterium]MBT5367322.1 aminotransferase class III-fold pyridoxal phosphate-dependent enzyme [Nitrospinaceae bacterium]MBT5949125.1 aminotransferase class III-fold pyridoxal phosphate-dependent enzyme [Nitrospinaceae bacterium]MBT6393473.1 aminotransferase class III-fold pyridoxal phosphate-dependent enzyme [Nitrospinaceae bacterium]
MPKPTAPSSLENSYIEALPASQALFERAQKIFPDGVTHDSRRMKPFPIYVERAEGALKWDADGNRYIDYWMGHGALLFGQNPPHVRDAVRDQAMRGTHYGACHEKEVEWGEWVCRLVPCAERVRFTASGTEATHMALRLARAFTGKSRAVKFAGHFHGWHEGLEIGVRAPYTAEPEAGQLSGVVDEVTVCPLDDIGAVRGALSGNDVAAVILEPTGPHFGTVPVSKEYLEALREETTKAGAVLIFDEVVTGFRVAPGGAQEFYGVVPDLSSFAKILAGGLPGGCVAGRADIMRHLETKETPEETHATKIPHHGTFNANPLSAAAGVAMLASIADGSAIRTANEAAAALRRGMNEILAQEKIAWKVYGEHSDWKFFFGADAPPKGGDDQSVADVPWEKLNAKFPEKSRTLRQAFILHGIDFNGDRALTGTVHTQGIVEETLACFAESARMLKKEGLA